MPTYIIFYWDVVSKTFKEGGYYASLERCIKSADHAYGASGYYIVERVEEVVHASKDFNKVIGKAAKASS